MKSAIDAIALPALYISVAKVRPDAVAKLFARNNTRKENKLPMAIHRFHKSINEGRKRRSGAASRRS